jgi:hypothetical protein
MDGPGKSVAKCNGGDKVIVQSEDGPWYPAKITNKPAAEGQCPVKYTDPDKDDEVVELKRIRQLD